MPILAVTRPRGGRLLVRLPHRYRPAYRWAVEASVYAVGVYRRIGWKEGAWRDVGWWRLELQPPGEGRPPEPLPPDP